MTNLAPYFQEALLGTFRGQPFAPPVVYVGLHDKTADGEVSGGGYSRQPVQFSVPTISDDLMSTENATAVFFSAPSTQVSRLLMFDDGGNELLSVKLEEELDIESGTSVVFDPGDIVVEMAPPTIIDGPGGTPMHPTPEFAVSPSGAIWRLVVTAEGAIQTRYTDHAPPQGATVLQDESGQTWRVIAENSGALETVPSEPVEGDRVFLWGYGPYLPSPDPQVLWQLSVGQDGALITTNLDTVPDPVDLEGLASATSSTSGDLTVQSDSGPGEFGSVYAHYTAETFELDDEDPVTSWPAEVGPTLNLVNDVTGTSVASTFRIVDGHPVVRFGRDAHRRLQSDNITDGPEEITIALVVRPGSQAFEEVFVSTGKFEGNHVFRHAFGRAGNYTISMWSGSSGSGTAFVAFSAGEWAVVVARWMPSTITAHVNGVSVFSDSTFPSGPMERIGVGGMHVDASRVDGDIAEVVIYDEVLDAQTTEDLSAYLMNKYFSDPEPEPPEPGPVEAPYQDRYVWHVSAKDIAGLEDQDPVTPWDARVGPALTFPGTTPPTYHTEGINGRPAISLIDDQRLIPASWTDIPQPYTVFVVFQQQGGISWRLFYGDGPDGFVSIWHSITSQWTMNAGAVGPSLDQVISSPTLLAARFQGTASFLRINENTATGDAGTRVLPVSAFFNHSAFPVSSNVLKGVVGELIVTTGAWTEAEIQEMFDYLEAEWID